MSITTSIFRSLTNTFFLSFILNTIVFLCFSLYAATQQQRMDQEAGTVKDIVKSGEPTLVKALIEGGLDVNTVFAHDGTLLIMAIRTGSGHVVDYLLKHGADVNLESPVDGNALIAAAKHNELAIAQQLLNVGAEIDAWVENDETALINAARAGHYKMVKFLLENGADANYGVQAREGFRSPLNQAKTASIKSLLKQHGATR